MRRYKFRLGGVDENDHTAFHFSVQAPTPEIAVRHANAMLQKLHDEHTGVVLLDAPGFEQFQLSVWLPAREITVTDIWKVE
jgi:hypothetical protein